MYCTSAGEYLHCICPNMRGCGCAGEVFHEVWKTHSINATVAEIFFVLYIIVS
jgi:hypothetical protein